MGLLILFKTREVIAHWFADENGVWVQWRERDSAVGRGHFAGAGARRSAGNPCMFSFWSFHLPQPRREPYCELRARLGREMEI